MSTVARLTYQGDDHLDKAIALALLGISGPMTCNVWQGDDDNLRFGHAYPPSGTTLNEWTPPDGWTKLPIEMTASEITDIARRWLNGPAKYPPEPRTDGSVKMGFKVDNAAAHSMATPELLIVTPQWTVYGK